MSSVGVTSEDTMDSELPGWLAAGWNCCWNYYRATETQSALQDRYGSAELNNRIKVADCYFMEAGVEQNVVEETETVLQRLSSRTRRSFSCGSNSGFLQASFFFLQFVRTRVNEILKKIVFTYGL